MADHSTSDGLDRVFASLEDGPAPTPPYADRLWSDLEATIERRAMPAGSTAEPVDPADVLTLPPQSNPGPRSRRFVVGRAAAVAAVAATITVVVIAADDDGDVPVGTTDQPRSTTTAPAPTLPVITDPDDACARYFVSAASIDRLLETTPTAAEYDQAIVAVEQLQRDLAASGDFDDVTLTNLRFARGGIIQAQAEAGLGEIERARLSLEAARDWVSLDAPGSGEPRCRPSE